MPLPKIGDSLIEYEFDAAEAVQAKLLTQLQICYLSTLHAQYLKLKSAEPIPEAVVLDRNYICKMAELDGKMGLIVELLDNHKQAVKDYSEISSMPAQAANLERVSLESRAAQHLKP